MNPNNYLVLMVLPPDKVDCFIAGFTIPLLTRYEIVVRNQGFVVIAGIQVLALAFISFCDRDG